MAEHDLQARLALMAAQGGFSEETLGALLTHLQGAEEEAVYRMSPLRYAEAQGLSAEEAIDLFVHATSVGLVDCQWGVLCPGCYAFLTTPAGLRFLRESRRCNFCEADILGSVDENVEVTFTVSPLLRPLRYGDPEAVDYARDCARLFFSPSLPPDSPVPRSLREELIFAGLVGVGAPTSVPLELGPGLYVLLAPGSHGALKLQVLPPEEGPATTPGGEIEIEMMDGAFLYPGGSTLPARGTLTLVNRTRRPIGMVLFRMPLGMQAPPPGACLPGFQGGRLLPYLTGKRLLTRQCFRDLFRAESIPPEGGLEIRSLTVLFTDLKDSTQLYEREGDVRAFDLVRGHFAGLQGIIRKNGGGIVKTIGDAIMATFPEPAAGVRTAGEMHRHMAEGLHGELRLKIGIHTGGCIAVDLNERLDFFGRTVNIAARVQGLAGACETLVTREVFDAPGVAEILAEDSLSILQEERQLRGIDGTNAVTRLRARGP